MKKSKHQGMYSTFFSQKWLRNLLIGERVPISHQHIRPINEFEMENNTITKLKSLIKK